MLYNTPSPVLISLLLLSMIGVAEGGLRLGARLGRTTWMNAKENLTGLTAAALALLGLMLAFSFSQAAGRHDARKTLLVEEANAILVVSHFLDYLSLEMRDEARDLLHRYAEERIAFLTVGHDAQGERQAIEQSRELGDALWRLVSVSGNYREPQSAPRAATMFQLTQAVSELAVAARNREEARARQVPAAVMFALLAMTVLGSGMLAYTAGATRSPDRAKMYAFFVFIGLVVYLIIDLDRPRRGLMRLSPAPLAEVLAVISRPH